MKKIDTSGTMNHVQMHIFELERQRRKLRRLLRVAEAALKSLASKDIHNVDIANVYWIEKARLEPKKRCLAKKRGGK